VKKLDILRRVDMLLREAGQGMEVTASPVVSGDHLVAATDGNASGGRPSAGASLP